VGMSSVTASNLPNIDAGLWQRSAEGQTIPLSRREEVLVPTPGDGRRHHSTAPAGRPYQPFLSFIEYTELGCTTLCLLSTRLHDTWSRHPIDRPTRRLCPLAAHHRPTNRPDGPPCTPSTGRGPPDPLEPSHSLQSHVPRGKPRHVGNRPLDDTNRWLPSSPVWRTLVHGAHTQRNGRSLVQRPQHLHPYAS
jgi:hypothetical protein